MATIEKYSWLFRMVCGIALGLVALPVYALVSPGGSLIFVGLLAGMAGAAVFDFFRKDSQADLILEINELGWTVTRSDVGRWMAIPHSSFHRKRAYAGTLSELQKDVVARERKLEQQLTEIRGNQPIGGPETGG